MILALWLSIYFQGGKSPKKMGTKKGGDLGGPNLLNWPIHAKLEDHGPLVCSLTKFLPLLLTGRSTKQIIAICLHFHWKAPDGRRLFKINRDQRHVSETRLQCRWNPFLPADMFNPATYVFPPGIQYFFVGSMRRKPNKTDKLLLPHNGFGDHWGLIRASHSSQWSFYPHVCQPLQVGCSQPFRNCFKHHTKKNCNEPAYQATYSNLPKSFPSWTRHIRRYHPWRCDAPTQWEPWEPWLQWSQRSQPETAETHR